MTAFVVVLSNAKDLVLPVVPSEMLVILRSEAGKDLGFTSLRIKIE